MGRGGGCLCCPLSGGQSNMMLALTHQSTQPLNSSYTYRDTLRQELAAVGPVMRVFVSRGRAPTGSASNRVVHEA